MRFAEIATWREFPAVLDAAHFVVIARPGTTLDGAAARTPDLRTRLVGRMTRLERRERLSFSSRRTRATCRPATIRARLAARQPIDDLVPAAVARHIVAHHLYGAVGDLHGQDSAISK